MLTDLHVMLSKICYSLDMNVFKELLVPDSSDQLHLRYLAFALLHQLAYLTLDIRGQIFATDMVLCRVSKLLESSWVGSKTQGALWCW